MFMRKLKLNLMFIWNQLLHQSPMPLLPYLMLVTLTMLLQSSTLLLLPNQLLQSPTPMLLLQLLLPPLLLLPLILPTLMLLLMPTLLSTPDVSTALDLLSLAHKPKTSMQYLYISTETKDYNYQKTVNNKIG